MYYRCECRKPFSRIRAPLHTYLVALGTCNSLCYYHRINDNLYTATNYRLCHAQLYNVNHNPAVAAVLLHQAIGLVVPLVGGGLSYMTVRRQLRPSR